MTGTVLDNRLTTPPVAVATATVVVVVVRAGFVTGRTAARDDLEAALRWE